MHGGLGADVDALGGFIEHQHPRRRHQPFGQHHLLLVAARQLFDGLGDIGAFDLQARAPFAGIALAARCGTNPSRATDARGWAARCCR